MIVTHETPPRVAPLYDPSGECLTCPGCEREYPLWQYKRLKRNPKYQQATAEVVKCPGCGHLFAPLPQE